MSSVQKSGSTSSAKKIQGSTTKQGKKAKTDASNKSKAHEEQPVKTNKPVKTTPAKEPKGEKNASGKPKTAEKQPGKVKSIPVKDETHEAQKRPRHSEAEEAAAQQERDARRIVLRGCPSTTTREDVKKAFPEAVWVFMVKKYGNFNGTCFVDFENVKQANAACQKTNVTIAGQAVTIHRREDKEAVRKEKAEREIVIEGCPAETKEEDVKKAFPAAEKVHLVQKYGKFNGTCFVTFATSAEADAACKRKGVKIAGQAVAIHKPAEGKALHAEERKCQITLLSCPFGMLEEDVRKVFPKAKRVLVVGHYTGKCYVNFATRDEAMAAYQQKIATIKDRIVHIYLDENLKEIGQDENARRIVIEGCPSTTKKEDVKEAFPKAEKVFLVRKKDKCTGTCFVTFATSDEADEAFQRTDVTIAGKAVTIHKPGKKNTSGKPTKATEKQPGKVKTTPVKDERHNAQKRTRHSEDDNSRPAKRQKVPA